MSSQNNKIKMFRDVDGKWRFRIKFKNGRIAATSEAYSDYRSAFDSASSINYGPFHYLIDESEHVESIESRKAQKEASSAHRKAARNRIKNGIASWLK